MDSIKRNILIVVVIGLGFIFYRGMKATTSENFNCEYKIVYAVCQPKTKDAKMPQISEIFREGFKF